jgi:IS1 family transposase
LILPPRDAVEMDELCVSRRRNVWLWTAVSRYTGQILGYVIGDRRWKHVQKLHSLLPARYQRRTVYTDGYEAYAAFFPPSRHRQCQKFDGGTSVVEGVNTSLRHRCSFLVRRHCGPREQPTSIESRLCFAVRAHNAGLSETLGATAGPSNAVNDITAGEDS